MNPEEFLYRFVGDEDDLIKSLRTVQEHLRTATGKKYKFNVEGSGFKEANAEIDRLEKNLLELNELNVHPEVEVVIQDALRDIAAVRGAMAALPNNKVINAQFRMKGEAALARAIASAQKLGIEFDKFERIATHGSLTPDPTKWDDFARAAGRVALQLRRLPSFIGGISIALVASFIPAILAAISAMAGMTAGVVALGSALAASLIPAVGVAAAVINRLTKVFQARTDLANAQESADAQAAAATQSRVQGERQLADAARAVADAQRGQQRASEDLASAQQALAEAAKQAFQEMEDAAEDARDAVLDLADAKLGLEEAALGVDEAKLALEQFRNEMGLVGDDFGDLFKKFTNVDVEFDGSVFADLAESQGLAKEDQLELEGLILRVRRAKLQEKQATDGVADAETNLQRARQRNQEFLERGIAASQSYQSAVEGVKAAEEGLADATRAVSDARRRQAETAQDVAASHDQMTTALAKARAEVKKLSPQEKRLFDAMEKVDGILERVKKRIAAPIFGTLAAGLEDLPSLLSKVQAPLILLSSAFARIGKSIGKKVFKEITDNFLLLTQGALGLSAEFGRIFSSMFGLVMNLAQAAMPALLRGVNDIADAFGRWKRGTDNTNSLRDALSPAFKLIRIVVAAIGDIGRALFNSFQGGKGPITDFFKFIRRGTKAFADFLGSTEGKKQVKEFFKDTLPFVKSLTKFIIKLGKVFLILLKIVLPIAKPIIDSFSFLADVLFATLVIINKLIGPFKNLIGEVLALFVGTGAVTKGFRAVGFVLSHFGAILGRAGKFFQVFAKEGVDSLKIFLRGIREFSKLVLNGIKLLMKGLKAIWSRVGGILTFPVRVALKVIETYFKGAVKVYSFLVRNIVKGIRLAWEGLKAVVQFVLDRFRAIRDLGGKIFEGLVSRIETAFKGVKSVVKTILNGLITIANKFIKAWNAVFGHERKIEGPFGVGSIKLPSLKLGEIPKLAAGGIVSKGTIFEAGEGSSREAVLPLSRSVLRSLGQAIMKAMPKPSAALGPMPPRVAAATAGASGHQGTVIHKQEVHLPQPPSGGVMDPRYAAVQFARELKRRGL